MPENQSRGGQQGPAATVQSVAVAVIVPMLDADDTVGEQLEALTRQTFAGAWEVVVADNGSRDRSREVALGYAQRLPLRLVDASGVRGVAHARNVGARATCAPLLAFVDADDVVADDWLEHIAAALQSHAAVASRFDKARLNPPDLQATRNLAQEHGLGEHNYARFLPHAGGSGLAVRREVHEAIGGFDERLLRLQDTDYSWRLQLAGHPLHYEPAAVLHVRFRPSGTASLKQAFLYGRYDGHLYQRYRGRGMARASLMTDFKQIAILLVKLPFGRDPLQRSKRQRTLANIAGIVWGRMEARWGRSQA